MVMVAQQSFCEPAAKGGYIWFQSQCYGNWRPIDGCHPSVPFGGLALTPARLQEHHKMPLKSPVDSKYAGSRTFSGPQPRNQDNYSIQAANVSLMRNSNILEQADFTCSVAMSFLGGILRKLRYADTELRERWCGRTGSLISLFLQGRFRHPYRKRRSKALDNPSRRR